MLTSVRYFATTPVLSRAHDLSMHPLTSDEHDSRQALLQNIALTSALSTVQCCEVPGVYQSHFTEYFIDI